jgi:hypothetical protein
VILGRLVWQARDSIERTQLDKKTGSWRNWRIGVEAERVHLFFPSSASEEPGISAVI